MQTCRSISEKVAGEYGLTYADIASRSRRPIVDIARTCAYDRIENELGLSCGEIGQRFGRSRQAVWKALKAYRASKPAPIVNEVDALAQHVKRLSGGNIATNVSEKLGLSISRAVMLSVFIENYPRNLSCERIQELHEHCMVYEMFRDFDATWDALRTIISQTKKAVREQGLPDPIEKNITGWRLSDGFARWANVNIRPLEIPS